MTNSAKNVEWYAHRYRIDRKCSCRGAQRGNECFAVGWHCVDSHASRSDAIRDAAIAFEQGGGKISYRILDTRDLTLVSFANVTVDGAALSTSERDTLIEALTALRTNQRDTSDVVAILRKLHGGGLAAT